MSLKAEHTGGERKSNPYSIFTWSYAHAFLMEDVVGWDLRY